MSNSQTVGRAVAGDVLVFSGIPEAGESVPPGYAFWPLTVLHDPRRRWDDDNNRYIPESGREYRIEVSLSGLDYPVSALTFHRPNPAASSKLPVERGQGFAHDFTGFHRSGGAQSAYLGLCLLNNSADDLIISGPSIEGGFWRIDIYATNVS